MYVSKSKSAYKWQTNGVRLPQTERIRVYSDNLYQRRIYLDTTTCVLLRITHGPILRGLELVGRYTELKQLGERGGKTMECKCVSRLQRGAGVQ